MNSSNPGARSTKRSAAVRSAAALLLGWLAVGCGPTEPGGSKPAGEPADSSGTLEIRAGFPRASISRISEADGTDTTLCELRRGGGLIATRFLIQQPDRSYSGVFTRLPPADDYTASVFLWDGAGFAAAFGEKTGIRIEAGKNATAAVELSVFRPGLTAPADGSILNETSPTFRWSPLRGASVYILQAAMDSSFRSQYFSCEGLTVCEYTHGAELGPGTVYWRVAARDAKGRAGLWSQTRRFSIGEAPGSFTLRGLGVRFGPWNPATNRAGDFLFLPGYTRLFWEFGLTVGDGQGGQKELPDFAYLIPMDTWVTAVAGGRIVRAVYQEDTRDWEFTAVSTADPDIQVGYDHLTEPRIGEGDFVAPGDTLGRPGSWDGVLGRVEFTILDVPAGQFRCPLLYLDPASADSLAGLIDRHMREWETFAGDTAVYHQEDQPYPGCRVESIVIY